MLSKLRRQVLKACPMPERAVEARFYAVVGGCYRRLPPANPSHAVQIERRETLIWTRVKNHILPTLGKLRLEEIGAETQQKFVSQLSGKVSRKTLLNILATLSSILGK